MTRVVQGGAPQSPRGPGERPRSRGSARTAILVGLGLLVSGLGVLWTGVHGDRFDGVYCLNNTRNMAQLLGERARRRGWPEYGGRRFVLFLTASRLVDPENVDNLDVYRCPLCKDTFRGEENDRRIQALTKESLRTSDATHLTSYAGRRNDEEAWRLRSDMDPADEAILGCRHGDEGIILGFADGKARWYERSELGLSDDEEIVFGDGARHRWLRSLSEE